MRVAFSDRLRLKWGEFLTDTSPLGAGIKVGRASDWHVIKEGVVGVIETVTPTNISIRFTRALSERTLDKLVHLQRQDFDKLDDPDKRNEAQKTSDAPLQAPMVGVDKKGECPVPCSERGFSVMLEFAEVDALGRKRLDVLTMEEVCATFKTRPDISEIWKTLTGRMAWSESAAGRTHIACANGDPPKRKSRSRQGLRATIRAMKLAKMKRTDDV